MGQIYPKIYSLDFLDQWRGDGAEPHQPIVPYRPVRYHPGRVRPPEYRRCGTPPTRYEEDRACALLVEYDVAAPCDDFFLSRRVCLAIIDTLEKRRMADNSA